METGVDWQKTDGADRQHPQGPGSRAEDDHPVVQVSWHDAVAYCERADDGHAYTAPAGGFPAGASWCGAHGMAGNVGERLGDWHDSDYYIRSRLRIPLGR